VVPHAAGKSVAKALEPVSSVEFLEFDGKHQIPEAVVNAVSEFLGS